MAVNINFNLKKISDERTRPGIYVLCCCLVLVHLYFFAIPVDAVARQRSILLINRMVQWVELSNDYQGMDSSSSRAASRARHHLTLEESYHLGGKYSVYSRRLVNGHFAFDLNANQWVIRDNTSRDSDQSGFYIEYDIDGTILDRSDYPLSFFSNSSSKKVIDSFSQDYDVWSTSSGISTDIHHKLFPSRASYTYLYEETDGLTVDRQRTTDNIWFNTRHLYKTISESEADFRFTSDRTQFDSVINNVDNFDSYSLKLSNKLKFGAIDKQKYLFSLYRNRYENGDRDIDNVHWNERLTVELGKALDWGADSRIDRENYRGRRVTRSRYESWIDHRLFKSLHSHFGANFLENEFSTGTEISDRYTASFAYNKILPSKSNLHFNYTYIWGKTDRDIADNQNFVINEFLTVSLIDNFLDNFNVILPSIVVYSQDRAITYLPGIDYTLRQVGSRTELVLTPVTAISVGETLSLDYAYIFNGSIEYATSTNSFSFNVDFNQGRYRLFGKLSDTDQDLIAGDDSAAPLLQRDYLDFGGEVSLAPYVAGLIYTDTDSSLEKYSSIEGYLRYNRVFASSTFNASLRNRYTDFQNVSTLNAGQANSGKENSLNLNLNYQRRLTRRIRAGGESGLLFLSGRNRDQDEFFLRLTVDARYGKFETSVITSIRWQQYESSRNRDDFIFLRLRRYL